MWVQEVHCTCSRCVHCNVHSVYMYSVPNWGYMYIRTNFLSHGSCCARSVVLTFELLVSVFFVCACAVEAPFLFLLFLLCGAQFSCTSTCVYNCDSLEEPSPSLLPPPRSQCAAGVEDNRGSGRPLFYPLPWSQPAHHPLRKALFRTD